VALCLTCKINWIKGLFPYAIGNELKRCTVPQIKGNKEVMIYYTDTGQAIYEKIVKTVAQSLNS